MSWRIALLFFFVVIIIIFFPLFLLIYSQYLSLAAPTKANIVIDVNKTVGRLPERWIALAQGGEEKGTRMLANVISQTASLYPRYIRLDHLYDFYDVVKLDRLGDLTFDWSRLDESVCDVYQTGAKPFFSLGYMPPAISKDRSPVSLPKDWDLWSLLVQKTIERYSGKETRICGQIAGSWLTDIYYEVWNEPDLDSFGKWTIENGVKNYKTLYLYSSLGATQAKNVNRFFLGGPSTSSLYQNWVLSFLDYVSRNNLKLDFISWHHYSSQPATIASQVGQLNYWLTDPDFSQYRYLPRIISEWGYDSEPNPLTDTEIGAAHVVASIRNFLGQRIEAAFLFEIKDGPTPRWGILKNDGSPTPRYKALQLLNLLEGNELYVEGEGTYISAIASYNQQKLTVILVNYDPKNLHTETVPVRITNLPTGYYTMTTTYLDGKTSTVASVAILGGSVDRRIITPPNSVVAFELIKE